MIVIPFWDPAGPGRRLEKLAFQGDDTGVLDGTSGFSYPNGQLASVEPYRKGILDGIVTQYCDNGALKARVHVVGGCRGGSKGEYFLSATTLQPEDIEMMKPFRLLCIFLVLALPPSAAAEPGTATRHLMNTPVSMLDFGIYKLDERLNRFRDDAQLEMGGIRPLVSVSYDYEADKIVVQYRYVIESLEAERYFARKDRKKEVKAMLDGVKRWYFGVDPETGAFLLGEASSLIYSFAHEGYVQKGAPEDLDRRLDERAEIRIAVFQDDWNSLQCRSMLLEKQVYCRDWQ